MTSSYLVEELAVGKVAALLKNADLIAIEYELTKGGEPLDRITRKALEYERRRREVLAKPKRRIVCPLL